MSYTPTEWHTGDIVTANKLNNLEQGVVDAQLPAYTSADKGKFLGLAEDAEHTETVVIIPEQTVTIVDPNVSREVALPDVDPSLIVIGETVTFSVNNVPTTDSFTEYGIDGAESTYIYINDGVVTFGGENAGNYVISLTKAVPSVEPKWEAADSVQLQVGQPTAVGNTANMAIYADNAELSSYAAVSAYLTAIKNKRLYVVVASGSAYFVYNSITISDDGAKNAYVLFAMSDGTDLHPVTAGWTESE